jgi:hypothetical protein
MRDSYLNKEYEKVVDIYMNLSWEEQKDPFINHHYLLASRELNKKRELLDSLIRPRMFTMSLENILVFGVLTYFIYYGYKN